MAIGDDEIGDAFEVDVEAYDGVDVLSIAREEVFRAATRTQKRWKKNLTKGRGAVPAKTSGGKRNPSWVNTGGGRSSITLEPQEQGALAYRVGSDKIQIIVAEVGRSPGEPPPPWAPIAQWAKEVGIVDTFYLEEDEAPESVQDTLTAIRMSIAKNGIGGFAPGYEAGKREEPRFRRRLLERTQAEIEAASLGT